MFAVECTAVLADAIKSALKMLYIFILDHRMFVRISNSIQTVGMNKEAEKSILNFLFKCLQRKSDIS